MPGVHRARASELAIYSQPSRPPFPDSNSAAAVAVAVAEAYDDAMNAFFTSLARGLDDLGRAGGLSSLPALLRAAALLRGLHSQLTLMVGQLHLPPGGRWLDEYMDETARLWDACLAVKLGLASVERYCAAASCAAAALDDWLQDPSPLATRQVGSSFSRNILRSIASHDVDRFLPLLCFLGSSLFLNIKNFLRSSFFE